MSWANSVHRRLKYEIATLTLRNVKGVLVMRAYEKYATRLEQFVKDRRLVVLEHLSFFFCTFNAEIDLFSTAKYGLTKADDCFHLGWGGCKTKITIFVCLRKEWLKYCSFIRLAVQRQWSQENKHRMLEFIFCFTSKAIICTYSYVLYKKAVHCT